MASASYQSTNDRPRWRGILLALLVEGLVALLLLQLGTGVFTKVEQPKLTTFDVKPIGPPMEKAAAKTKLKTQQKKVVTTTSAAPPPPTVPPLPKAPLPSKLIQVSPEDFAASDIGKIKGAKGDNDGDEGTGKNSVAAYGPGEGPGGGSLYNAEWYREPSDAELKPYMQQYVKDGTGWAMIACRTAPDYRVENCRSLDESPPGGGLSRALRLAAWQFRVRPPRVNGKAMIGAWVKIRFDLTVGFRK